MKYTIVIALLILSYSFCFGQDGQDIVMTIGDKQVTKTEFERIYKKNNSTQDIDSKTLHEYLDLFINFKLKVIEAESLQMDTANAFIKELAGYRKQLARPYMSDREVEQKMIQEAYDRMTVDIHARHILIKLPQNPTPEDTLSAYKKITNIKKQLDKGGDFEKLANENSEDDYCVKTKNGGDLGYFSAFRMVYPFECAAYNTQVGKYSEPFRTDFGYHIVKIDDKRPTPGKVRVAHIMIAVPEGTPQNKQDEAKSKIFKIYNDLSTGKDFAKMAAEHSDDKGSARRGGELPWFGTGQMVREFEDAAFKIENPGELSEPVQTSYGWHIIKLLEKKPLGSFEELENEIKSKISRDVRATQSKKSIIKKLKEEYAFNLDKKAYDAIKKVVDTSVLSGNWDKTKAEKLNSSLFTFADKKYTQQDFVKYIVENMHKTDETDLNAFIDMRLDRFVERELMQYEENRLEEKYPDFKYLMQEYHDGILLFELTDKMVWSKAVKDSAGLVAFHEKHKQNYMWPERVDASIYTCDKSVNVENARKVAEKRTKKGWSKVETEAQLLKIEKDTVLSTEISDGKFAKGDNYLIDEIEWKPGLSQNISKGDQTVFVFVNQLLPSQPKAIDEARGLITADYQTYLETKWIEELKKKYKIEVNEEVLNKIK